jgi:hypothetical protein
MASMVSDRQGKLWCELDANIVTTGSSRQANDVMQNVIEITRQDWRREIAIERDPHADLAYIELGGIAYSGATTGTFDAYLSGAPGEAPEYFGSVQRASGLVIVDQNQINELSGLTWAQRNALYPKVRIPLAGEYRFLDIAPQQRVEMTVATDETFRRITWNQKPFIPQAITYRWNPSRQSLLMDMVVSEETHGPPGDTVIIPVDPPYDRRILPDWDIDFPPIIPPDPIVPPIIPPEGSGNLIYLCTGNRLTRSRDLIIGMGTGSTWEDISPTFGGSGVTGSFQSFRLDPIDPINTAWLMTRVVGGPDSPPDGPRLYRINSLDGITGSQTYTEILDPQIWRDTLSGENADSQGMDFAVNAVNTNVIIVSGTKAAIGQCAAIRTANQGGSWVDISNTGLSHANNAWTWLSEKGVIDLFLRVDLDRRIVRSRDAGETFEVIWNPTGDVTEIHIPFHANPADLIMYGSNNSDIFLTRDAFTTPITITPNYDGTNWHCFNQGGQRGEHKPTFATHYLNRLLVAALMVPNSGDANRRQFFYATDGVDGGVNSWRPGFRFPSGDVVRNLVWHQTNANILACIQVGGTDAIWFTVNSGITFLDAVSSWERDIGTIDAPDSLGFDVVGLWFVWSA